MKNIDTLHYEHIMAVEAEKMAFKALIDKIYSEAQAYEIECDALRLYTDSEYRVTIVNKIYNEYDLCICSCCGEKKIDASNDGDQICQECIDSGNYRDLPIDQD